MKVVIIGGVAGGMSAATRLRRLMEDAEIIVLDKGPYVSFANCGLPFHVSGEIADRSQLIVQSPEQLKARFNIDVRPENEVVSIDKEARVLTINAKDGSYQESYDKLLLSPGAIPFVPKMDGLDQAKNVFALRNIPDLDQILEHAASVENGKATVIGAGFIGLEMAENLAKRGFDVTILEKAPHILPPFDVEMASYLQEECEKNGITVKTGISAQAFENEGQTIVLEDGSKISSDLTILSVGVQPASQLAKDAGLELGLKNGILVNENYQTSDENIYAVGDAIIVKQQITGDDALISLASPANRQGRQVADVIAGYKRQNKGSIGTAIVRLFTLAAASTGLSERIARQTFDHVQVVHISGKSHASYYPEAKDIVLKLIFDAKTGKIYGAQAVGEEGVDKRIDIISTAIKADMTVFDLPELEFTYAPPFGSAKDPVNMAGYAAINLVEGISDSVQWYELEDELNKGNLLLDVRNPGEIANGRFENAIEIPLDQLRDRLSELDKNESYIITCHSGLRSYIGERILKQNGYTVRNLDGAYQLYNIVLPERIIHD